VQCMHQQMEDSCAQQVEDSCALWAVCEASLIGQTPPSTTMLEAFGHPFFGG